MSMMPRNHSPHHVEMVLCEEEIRDLLEAGVDIGINAEVWLAEHPLPERKAPEPDR